MISTSSASSFFVGGMEMGNAFTELNDPRDQEQRFLDMGCRIERSLQLCGLINAVLNSPEAGNPSVLETVLEVCDSTITYRSRYNLLPHPAAVLDLVLLDDTNPRSLLFQLNQLVKHFDRLPQEQRSALPTARESARSRPTTCSRFSRSPRPSPTS